jgi:hypothetical protein
MDSSFRDGPKDQTRNLKPTNPASQIEIPGSPAMRAPRNDGINISGIKAMRAEIIKLVEEIKQSVGLLRRHL